MSDELRADYGSDDIKRRLNWKTCPECGNTFMQSKPPKAVQTYCTWACHLKARDAR